MAVTSSSSFSQISAAATKGLVLAIAGDYQPEPSQSSGPDTMMTRLGLRERRNQLRAARWPNGLGEKATGRRAPNARSPPGAGGFQTDGLYRVRRATRSRGPSARRAGDVGKGYGTRGRRRVVFGGPLCVSRISVYVMSRWRIQVGTHTSN